MTAALISFRDAIRAAGLVPPDAIEAGRFHRFPGIGKRNGNTAGFCKLFPDGRGGIFGDFSTGLVESWQEKHTRPLTLAEREAFREHVDRARAEAEAARREEQAQAARKAAEIWNAAKPAPADHPYLQAKGIKPHGARVAADGRLIVPLRDVSGELQSLQFIAADGEKRFLPGGRVTGCYFCIGKPGGRICIAEGYATGATICEAAGCAVAVAFDCGNLRAVADALRAKYPDGALTLCADDDYRTPSNPGLTKATEAARAIGGRVAVPDFGADRPEGATDFNDLAQCRGAEAVERAVATAEAPDTGNDDQQAREKATDTDSASVQAVKDELRVVLDAIATFVARFVAMPARWYQCAVVLWVAHAHMVKYFHTSPRLAPVSPEPESGKSRLLEIVATLTPNPMLMLSPSPAALFRKLKHGQVTLLVDECDTVFTARGKDDQNEDLRALLNAGYRRGATIPRCVGPRHDVEEFPVFAATALAGIGDLPDTIMTRAIVLRMRRRTAAEPIEQYRIRIHEAEGHQLRDRLARCAEALGPTAGAAWPKLPDGVVDRRAEAWEPLIAIADLAGADWPDRAREAAVADVAAHRGREPSLGIRLLADIRTAMGEASAICTEDLLQKLHAMLEAPWGDLRGKPLDSRGLASRLKAYGVTPKDIRDEKGVRKGYRRVELHDPWTRYLSHPQESATCATSATNGPAGAVAEGDDRASAGAEPEAGEIF